MTQNVSTSIESRGTNPDSAGGGLLQGAAFALLCLWTLTSPDRLRDQLSPGTGGCAALGF